jgi:hypothetical protein
VTALLALAAAPAALALPPEPLPGPTPVVHQVVNTNSGKALTAGATGSLYLSTRSATNTAQQFRRKTLPESAPYLYRYESVKFPGKCMGATVSGTFGTPAMIPCGTGPMAWRFYDPNMDASSGIFTIETPAINNGHALNPSGASGLKFDATYWSTSGQVPPPSAFWHDNTIAVD